VNMKTYFPVACALLLGACVDASSGLNDTEDDLKKKVTPTTSVNTGMRSFQLTKPGWVTSQLRNNTFQIAGKTIEPGETVLLGLAVAGAPTTLESFGLSVATGSECIGFEEGIKMGAGAQPARAPSAFRIKYDRELTIKYPKVSIARTVSPGLLPRWCEFDGAELSAFGTFVGPRSYTVSISGAALSAQVATPGDLTELVLPTTDVVVKMDDIDPLFPTSSSAPIWRVYLSEASNTDTNNSLDLRPNAGSETTNRSRSHVVPKNRGAQLKLASVSSAVPTEIVDEVYPTLGIDAKSPISIQLNRLEVEDVQVTVNGSTTSKKGTATIYKSRQILAVINTHTGIDLPNGTYTIVSETSGPLGPVSHTATVSFP
jgi:hypothetical protein